jgi:hypothetical protein
MLTANSRASHTAHAVLIAALVATTGLTTVVGLTDPAAPVFYPSGFWNLCLAWIPVFSRPGSQRCIDVSGCCRWVWAGWHSCRIRRSGPPRRRRQPLASRPAVRIRAADGHHARRDAGWMAVIVSIGLRAIGRLQRWSSWDLVTQPKAARLGTFSVRKPPVDRAALFGLAYLTIWSFGAAYGHAQSPAPAPAQKGGSGRTLEGVSFSSRVRLSPLSRHFGLVTPEPVVRSIVRL